MTEKQRREYIRAAKQQFHQSDSIRSKYTTEDEQESMGHRHWKARFLLALLFFAILYGAHKTENSQLQAVPETIAAVIEKDLDLEAMSSFTSLYQ